ncbi:hypothetical protein BDV24DRAFT_162225 [Aspergillus arachidicola]|uniref:Uncharacterized protein n=1 Tax=Aspergillus arachidicola TaxID=656916 RepID=A0A5N6YB59_9EURO|nr:hypothetical protein BDV24DRAFT_162225 [Aspergillus arachidicola]
MNVGLNFPDSPSPENVKWQTAWFALVSLGLAAMMQPCGNVLGQRTKNHRFYIRASPVVCAADMVQFIAFVLLGFSHDPQVWLRNVKFELRERFEGESGAKDREAAENSIIIRWILMIMGAYGFQVIKLMAMRGVPWTQAWAMMFATSILFGEVLLYTFLTSMTARLVHPLAGAATRYPTLSITLESLQSHFSSPFHMGLLIFSFTK